MSTERAKQPLAIPLTIGELTKERARRERKQELICHTHDKIKDAAERINQYDLSNARISDIDQMHSEIIELSDYIIELVDYAKARGQAMEDRLSLYRHAILDLGFERKS